MNAAGAHVRAVDFMELAAEQLGLVYGRWTHRRIKAHALALQAKAERERTFRDPDAAAKALDRARYDRARYYSRRLGSA